MATALISVIIPVYNAEKTIIRALESVRAQTFPAERFEIIVTDDGSTDGSFELCRKFKEQHPELQMTVITQRNAGVSAARNAGLKIAAGKYIAFLDADDEWYPQKTQRQLEILENRSPAIDFLSCRRKNQQILFPYRVEQNGLAEVTFLKLMFRNEAQPSTVIFKRKILDNTGYFDPRQKYAEDVNYWLRISEKNRMFILDEELVIAGGGKRTFGVSGLSANLPEMEKGFRKNLKEMHRMRRISTADFICYWVFYRLKYFFRITRDLLLRLQGK